jgi:hypothetical protein
MVCSVVLGRDEVEKEDLFVFVVHVLMIIFGLRHN